MLYHRNNLAYCKGHPVTGQSCNFCILLWSLSLSLSFYLSLSFSTCLFDSEGVLLPFSILVSDTIVSQTTSFSVFISHTLSRLFPWLVLSYFAVSLSLHSIPVWRVTWWVSAIAGRSHLFCMTTTGGHSTFHFVRSGNSFLFTKRVRLPKTFVGFSTNHSLPPETFAFETLFLLSHFLKKHIGWMQLIKYERSQISYHDTCI